MSNQQPVSEGIGLDEVDLQASITVEESSIKVNVSDNDKPKRRSAVAANDGNMNFAASRSVAEGMMDLALLTANANQLRFLITYNSQSSTFFVSMGLIISSLVLQVAVARKNGRKSSVELINRLLIVGVLMITFVNILIAALTSTDSGKP